MTPRLSILICSIPSRFDKARVLYEHILSMVDGKEVEVLLFMDNKKRTIGEKREALKNISNGKYFMFCDDDDSLYSIDEVYEAAELGVDVITFQSKARNADGSEFIVTFGLNNPTEHNTENGRYLDIKRPPYPCCAWSSEFKDISFAPVNYGEDAVWVQEAMKDAVFGHHIDKVIHGYNWDPQVTEASTESNKHWQNPNEPIKRCVVNLVTNEHYKRGQDRLCLSMKLSNPEIDTLYFMSEGEVDAPSHLDNPYAFKIYAIERAREQGYNQILWLDASVYPVKDITPVFDWLTEKGIFMEEAGHYCGTWSPDYVLNYFGITKEEAMKMPMFSAGFCGFDFRNPVSIEFFDKWKAAMMAGMFKGRWDESRHDMVCGSIIANQMGLLDSYSSGGQFFAYIGPGYGEPKETVVCHLQGL
jgi:hypothetical protein